MALVETKYLSDFMNNMEYALIGAQSKDGTGKAKLPMVETG